MYETSNSYNLLSRLDAGYLGSLKCGFNVFYNESNDFDVAYLVTSIKIYLELMPLIMNAMKYDLVSCNFCQNLSFETRNVTSLMISDKWFLNQVQGETSWISLPWHIKILIHLTQKECIK